MYGLIGVFVRYKYKKTLVTFFAFKKLDRETDKLM